MERKVREIHGCPGSPLVWSQRAPSQLVGTAQNQPRSPSQCQREPERSVRWGGRCSRLCHVRPSGATLIFRGSVSVLWRELREKKIRQACFEIILASGKEAVSALVFLLLPFQSLNKLWAATAGQKRSGLLWQWCCQERRLSRPHRLRPGTLHRCSIALRIARPVPCIANTDSNLHQICTPETSNGHLVENCDLFVIPDNSVNEGLTLAGSAKVRERQRRTRRGCFIHWKGLLICFT